MKNIWIVYILIYLQIEEYQTNVVALTDGNLCHHGIMKIFNWCEQSECKNCTCSSSERVCKQICSLKECDQMTCSSPLTCHQTTLAYKRLLWPIVHKLTSQSPRTHQECSQGYCKHMQSIRYNNMKTISFQSCSEGKCDTVESDADYAKQFCGDCKLMSCAGAHVKNCTQLCVLGGCKNTTCSAKHCDQKCLHDSSCNLTCTSDVETCHQTCGSGSSCRMRCDAKTCVQKCDDDSNCIINNKSYKTTTTSVVPTTERTATSTPTPTKKIFSSANTLNGKLYFILIFVILVLAISS